MKNSTSVAGTALAMPLTTKTAIRRRNAGLAQGDTGALQALALAYGLLPCALKLLAAGLLYGAWMRSPHGEPT